MPLSVCLYPVSLYLQAELGLNEHHQNEAISYMRFARFKRGLCLKTVDSCFQDLKDSRYHKGVLDYVTRWREQEQSRICWEQLQV